MFWPVISRRLHQLAGCYMLWCIMLTLIDAFQLWQGISSDLFIGSWYQRVLEHLQEFLKRQLVNQWIPYVVKKSWVPPIVSKNLSSKRYKEFFLYQKSRTIYRSPINFNIFCSFLYICIVNPVLTLTVPHILPPPDWLIDTFVYIWARLGRFPHVWKDWELLEIVFFLPILPKN